MAHNDDFIDDDDPADVEHVHFVDAPPEHDGPEHDGPDHDRARFHVDDYHYHHTGHVIDGPVVHLDDDPCADDDCARDHVHVIPVDEFHEFYVERPRFHEHDIDFNVYRRLLRHDHDGRALPHLHWPDSVQYAYNVVLPRPTTPRDRVQ